MTTPGTSTPTLTMDANSLPHERSPDYRYIYSTNINLRMTPQEFVLRAAHLDERGLNNLVMVEDVVLVIAPEHAKNLAQQLNTMIATYEQHIGPIGTPKSANPAAAYEALVEAAQKLKSE